MAKPKIDVQVQPLESGKLVFLPMAPHIVPNPLSPANSTATPRGRLCLQFVIVNNEPAEIFVQQVTVAFPGSSVASGMRTIGKSIPKGFQLPWAFQNPEDHFVFNLPAPATVKLSVFCAGFSEPCDLTVSLAPHANPVAGGAYRFPAKDVDLALGEFWQMNGCSHDTAGDGSQAFAYDMGVWGVDHDTGHYSHLRPRRDDGTATDGTRNADYRCFGKPLYAMADGTVIEAVNDCLDNPAPLQWTSDADLTAKMAQQGVDYWNASKNGVAGNHFYIQHGDELVLYAHMQKGSLDGALLRVPGRPNPTVVAGQFLGLAGNSGNSTAPHTHIDVIRGTLPNMGSARPFLFRSAYAIDADLITRGLPISPPGVQSAGLWTRMEAQGIPEGDPIKPDVRDSLLWPSGSRPEWPESVQLAVPEDSYQTQLNFMRANGLYPVLFASHTIDKILFNKTLFDVVYRPALGLDFKHVFGLTADEYQAEYNRLVFNGTYRMQYVDSYFSHVHNQVCYAATFVNTAGTLVDRHAPRAYHAQSEAAHDSFRTAWLADGYIPVNVSVVSMNGTRSYTALYEHRSVGGLWTRSKLTPAGFQQEFDSNLKNGLHLAYLKRYLHQGSEFVSAIWHDKVPSPFVSPALDSSSFFTTLRAQRKAKRLLRGVAAVQTGGDATFTGIWS